ncbi:MAG TPA: ParB/RepB/Spo0J family partition protein [Longimicrobiaceae bacterium]|nr:ParB/RepB/Spo0J family partition protein [Longimicrobiaceae bacterium]
MVSKHGLGRGLGALLPATPEPAAAMQTDSGGVQQISVDAIRPNPRQPRKDFEINRLNELSASLKQSGLLQPVVVRRDGQGFQLIVGERRWRAAKLAGIERIPAVVREASDAESLELALVENLLREDLNPMEEAEAYQTLLAEFNWTQEDLAERIGKDRSSVANCLRLLRLPEPIQADLRAGRLAMGHARALLALGSLADQLKLREEILAHSWSVRATEEGVKKKAGHLRPRPSRRSPELTALEDAFREKLATRVRLVGNERQGRIEIAYTSREDLDRLAELLTSSRP